MKILYIMHVDWGWIKQRPHFIATELLEKHELFILYPFSRHRSVMQKKNKKNFKYLPFLRIPGFGIMKGPNGFWWKLIIFTVIRCFSPEIIWIGHPHYGWYIPKSFKGKIVYDCMDDHIALEAIESEKMRIFNFEKYLVNKANLILISSERIGQVLKNRFGIDIGRMKLIRNGFDGRVLQEQNVITDKDKVIIGYIGTIAEWFDFNLIISSLEKYPKLEYHLIGPCRTSVQCYTHPRLIMHSTVEHNNLYNIIKDYDCLIMPFLLNDIVESVDPVKLYEYINFNKNIISIKYKEITRFNDFVHFYSDQEEFLNLINDIMKSKLCKKYTDKMRIEFLTNNTWKAREVAIEYEINKMLGL